jgi:hypothetical protein
MTFPFRNSLRLPPGDRTPRFRSLRLPPGGRPLRSHPLPGGRGPPFRSSPRRPAGSKILRTGSSTRRPCDPNLPPDISSPRAMSSTSSLRSPSGLSDGSSPRSPIPPVGSSLRSPSSPPAGSSPRSGRGSRLLRRPHGRSLSRAAGLRRRSRNGMRAGSPKRDERCGRCSSRSWW